jgi:hypothetical protein
MVRARKRSLPRLATGLPGVVFVAWRRLGVNGSNTAPKDRGRRQGAASIAISGMKRALKLLGVIPARGGVLGMGSPLSRSRQARRWHCDADALSRGHNRLHHCRSWAWNCRAWPATVVSRAYRRRSGSSSVSTFNRGLPLSGRPRPLAPMLRPQFGLAFVRPDRLARFGGLCHLGLDLRSSLVDMVFGSEPPTVADEMRETTVSQ